MAPETTPALSQTMTSARHPHRPGPGDRAGATTLLSYRRSRIGPGLLFTALLALTCGQHRELQLMSAPLAAALAAATSAFSSRRPTCLAADGARRVPRAARSPARPHAAAARSRRPPEVVDRAPRAASRTRRASARSI